jgi:hypothetical protein
VPSSAATLSALWAAVAGAGLPQVTTVNMIDGPFVAAVSLSSTTSSGSFVLVGFAGVSAFASAQQAAFSAGLSRLLGTDPVNIFFTSLEASSFVANSVDVRFTADFVNATAIAAISLPALVKVLQVSGLPQLIAVQVRVSFALQLPCVRAKINCASVCSVDENLLTQYALLRSFRRPLLPW